MYFDFFLQNLVPSEDPDILDGSIIVPDSPLNGEHNGRYVNASIVPHKSSYVLCNRIQICAQ